MLHRIADVFNLIGIHMVMHAAQSAAYSANRCLSNRETAVIRPYWRLSSATRLGQRAVSLLRAKPASIVVLAAGALVVPVHTTWSQPQKVTGSGTAGVVTPDDFDDLEPQVKAYLMRFIDNAHSAPNDADGHAALGLAYAANDLWDPARACFETSLRLKPDQRLTHYYLGIATAALGDVNGALTVYRQLIERHPDFAPGQHRLGHALLRSGMTDRAESAFRQTVKLAPGKPHGYIGLADVMLRKGEFITASELLEQTLQLRPGERMAHYLLGLAYRGLGRTDDARRQLALGVGAGLRYMPDPWSRRLGDHGKGLAHQMRRAREYMAAGHTDRALQILQTAHTWHRQNVELMNELSIVRMMLGQSAEALDILHRALSLDDSCTKTHVNLAAWHMAAERYEDALPHADRAVELSPNSADAHHTRGGILRRLQRDSEGLAELRQAVRLNPANPQYNVQLGEMLAQLGKLTEAKDHYHAAVARAPDMLQAHLGLCALCIETKDVDAAKRALADAQRIAPNDARVVSVAKRIGGSSKP